MHSKKDYSSIHVLCFLPACHDQKVSVASLTSISDVFVRLASVMLSLECDRPWKLQKCAAGYQVHARLVPAALWACGPERYGAWRSILCQLRLAPCTLYVPIYGDLSGCWQLLCDDGLWRRYCFSGWLNSSLITLQPFKSVHRPHGCRRAFYCPLSCSPQLVPLDYRQGPCMLYTSSPALSVCCLWSVSYTHLTLPTNREV